MSRLQTNRTDLTGTDTYAEIGRFVFKRYYHIIISILVSIIAVISVFTLFDKECIAGPKSSVIEKITELVGNKFEEQYKKAGFTTMPDYISLRVYKTNGILEVWGGTNRTDPLKRIASYDVCAMDFLPGTKIMQGDERTPEGSYELTFINSSKNWWMHVNLSADHLDDPGNVKKDPAFYVCTDYPNAFDKAVSKSTGAKSPGSGICIHGNCVSAGCVSMKNHDWIEIYYWLSRHNTELYGKPRAHILPFQYYTSCKNRIINTAANLYIHPKHPLCPTKYYQQIHRLASPETYNGDDMVFVKYTMERLGSDVILKLWEHIAKREMLFLTNPTPENAELQMSLDILK